MCLQWPSVYTCCYSQGTPQHLVWGTCGNRNALRKHSIAVLFNSSSHFTAFPWWGEDLFEFPNRSTDIQIDIQKSAMTWSSMKEIPVSQPWILTTTSFQESIIQLNRTWIWNDQIKGKEGTVKSTEGNPQLERKLWSGRRTRKGKIAGEWEWGKVF